ncbi:ABC transporter ATP-binding protein [Treponema sp. OMZ 840]|uniref:ABC transporter ATP-binding protein n=1 Tax=Treponema sp. OMZ 840 TaxID=244313 RepID=UPI003D8FA755
METILKTENLNKRFFKKQALRDVNLELKAGRILGLMGPNGSGKTTLLKIAAGLQKPSSGSISICGLNIGSETKALTALLPDRNTLPLWMTASDACSFYADYFDDFAPDKARDMLDFMKLGADEKVSAMSKGMIEKLNLTLTFSRKAKLFLLDEPLGGIDPVARERIVSTIIKNYSEDSSVLISTHLIHDIETMFDDVCFIKEGEIALYGEAEKLRSAHGASIDQLYIKTFQDL